MIFSAELLVQTVLSGLMVGVLYALMALGITFIYSIVKTINWAMGEFYMIGSYIQFVAVHYLLGARWWWLAAIISAAGTFLVGLILEPILIKPMYARPMQRRDDYATVVTIALLLLLRSLAVATSRLRAQTLRLSISIYCWSAPAGIALRCSNSATHRPARSKLL